MSEKERPLPEPAFGRKGRYEEREGQQLMADEIAHAAAEGRLEDFLKKEVPDNDYARKLVSMMMGMTGMAPVMDTKDSPKASTPSAEAEPASQPEVPPGVTAAARQGDVTGLMGILREEYSKRFSGEGQDCSEQMRADKPVKPTIERDVIETLVKISADNDVSLDWLTLRALRLYVQEYQRTGRL
ncbi:MAG TPA: hypothetical protein VLD55_03100 [Candidatus Sulfobium mesophilum]|nr:hypothetical protein [Candidatus Sulfobium mesophilum]